MMALSGLRARLVVAGVLGGVLIVLLLLLGGSVPADGAGVGARVHVLVKLSPGGWALAGDARRLAVSPTRDGVALRISNTRQTGTLTAWMNRDADPRGSSVRVTLGRQILRSGAAIRGTAWHQLALRWGRGGLELFIDGAPVESYSARRLTPPDMVSVSAARLAGVAPYDRALTRARLAEDYLASTVDHGLTAQPGAGRTATLRASSKTPPTNSAPPTISGTPQDGQTLASTTGTWSGNSISYTRQWLRCDAPVAALRHSR
jgi:hypothetical protein